MKMRLLRLISMSVVLALMVASCGRAATPTVEPTKAVVKEPFVIALVGPITGSNAQYGEFLKNATQLAVNDINKAGGIDGRLLELVVADDQMDPKQSPLVAQRLADDKRVLAVIGHFASTNSLAAMPIYNRVGVPMITPSSTSDSLTGISKWFFRVPTLNSKLGSQTALYGINQLGAKRIVVMKGESEGLNTLQSAFEAAVATTDAKLLSVETHQIGDQDFAAQITKIKPLRPDLVYLNTFAQEGGLIVKQAQEAGLQTIFIGTEAINSPDFLKLGGPASEGTYVPVFWDPTRTDPMSQKFVSDYKAAYGDLPEQYGAHAYSAVMIIADVLRSGAHTREAIQKYLDEVGTTKGFDTMVAHIKWDKNHDPDNPLTMLQVKNGAWVLAPKQP